MKRILAFILTFFLAVGAVNTQVWAVSESEQSGQPSTDSLLPHTAQRKYAQYLSEYADVFEPQKEIAVDALDYRSASACEAVEDASGKALLTGESSLVEYVFPVAEAGLYNLEITYRTTENGSASPERTVLVNGELPFSESAAIPFPRVWRSKDSEIRQDSSGNDIRPFQITVPEWQTRRLQDSRGLYAQPLQFFFQEGENVLSLQALREELVLGSIRLTPAKNIPSYDQVLADWKSKGCSPATGELLILEGEATASVSDPTLYPISDRASPMVSPYKGSKTAINAVGGANWKNPGQAIRWSVHVEEDGLYQIALKSKQDLAPGRISYRKLTIDEETPFQEAEQFSFSYTTKWVNHLLSDENGTPYWFYLEAGDHVLSLEPVLGELSRIVRQLESAVSELNQVYRKIIAITGTSPDAYRDYDLHLYLPDIMTVFAGQAELLHATARQLAEITGTRNGESALMENTALQLDSFVKKPRTIAKRLSSYKSNLSGLATLILTLGEQPLTIDYLMVGSAENNMPKAEAGFFKRLFHEVSLFFASFTENYETVSSQNQAGDELEHIELWMVTGRDQAQVVKQLSEDSLTSQLNIAVDLKLVQSGNLMPSVLSGTNPDVVIQAGMADPVNYAMRGALVDLSTLDGFTEITKRFHESAMVPYQLQGGVYALPETQSFPLLFYRKDILDELNLKVPQTWDEMIQTLSVLQKHNLEIGLPYSNSGTSSYGAAGGSASGGMYSSMNTSYATLNGGMQTFMMMLLQKGGELYRDGGRVSNLDSETAIEAFTEWTNFYANYNLPLTYDFANRFRLGELPLAVVDYTNYNLLSVFAPEINGLWDFAPVPGTLREDGTIDRSVTFVGTAAMIFDKNNDHKEASWKFLDWWTSADTQARYGREMENLLGASARYATANMEALSQLPWSANEYNMIREQMNWIVGTPEVPGGYFTPRHVDNAFRAAVLNTPRKNPRDSILDYIGYINEELDVKQREFGAK